MKIEALAAFSAKSELQPFHYDSEKLGPQDVRIRITHCGICHSDLHLIHNDWGISSYPLVPGHEIVGLVDELGEAVTHLARGQRVGIGWQRSACLNCEQCISGNENLCGSQGATCVGHHGGFAEAVVVDSRFAFAIPDRIESSNAAPLLCGGITVYSPLHHFGVRPEQRVGVIGIGGLGHLALQFAAAYGCEVTALSSSKDKEAEARGFGAKHFLSSVDTADMRAASGSLDFIISTVNADLDWTAYLNLLRPDGTLCFVGVPSKPISIPAFPLISGRKRIVGSPIGGRATITAMLAFAERHGIQAQTEVLPWKQANTALEKVASNRARYRMVLEMNA